MRAWIIRLGLIAFGFFIVMVSMIALEFGLGRFAPNLRTLYEEDEYIGWKGVPDKGQKYINEKIVSYVKMNSHGFRDKERTYEKKEDAFRILALGDSMTEGREVPLEQTFPYILERRLNSEKSSSDSPTSLPLDRYPRSQRFEVINLGIEGFGTAQEYLTLKYYGLKYKPDLVILAFFIGNDVRDNSLALRDDPSRPYFILNNGKLEEMPFRIAVGSPVGVAGRYRTLKYLSAKFFPNISYSLEGRIKETSWLSNSLGKVGITGFKHGLNDQYHKGGILSDYYVYTKEYTPEWENAWEVTKGLILKLKEELETDKIGFLVVVIPGEFEFRPDIWDKILDENSRMKAMEFDLRKPERTLSNFLEASNIDYLLLRPEFEEYTKKTGKDLYFSYKYDIHWNADGHALAAELIYKKLKEGHIAPYKEGGHV